MSEILNQLALVNLDADNDKIDIVNQLENIMEAANYKVVDRNDTKPWGAYLRFDNIDAQRFIETFFPGLSFKEAQLGIDNAELSPKLLVVSPGQRLSWQKHDRRAERWVFLTDGAYYKSSTDEQGEVTHIQAGGVVQFSKGERHRLAGVKDKYVLVAEIWQHSDPNHLSDEDDIIRLADDYERR